MARVTMGFMAYAQWPNVEADLAPWEIFPALKPTLAEVEELLAVVEEASDERPIQAHLAAKPRLFSPLLGGGHGRWVRPKVRFSDRFEADFMIADADSVGIHWVYVELESPRAPMFLQNGELAEKTRHGIHQIHQWRDHVDRNGGEARRLRSEGGLGLPEVRPKGWGIVLVGRTEESGADPVQRRRQLEEDERIMVHSYDWLVDQIRAVAEDGTWAHHPGGLIPYRKAELDEHIELRHKAEAAGIYPDGFDPDGSLTALPPEGEGRA
jgi:Domain of unknown function (DUF4263)